MSISSIPASSAPYTAPTQKVNLNAKAADGDFKAPGVGRVKDSDGDYKPVAVGSAAPTSPSLQQALGNLRIGG